MMPTFLMLVAAVVDGPTPASLELFYGEKLRASLFSGFMTMAGFLFAMKTFIVVNLNKEVYQHEEYQRRVDEMRDINPALDYFGPLRRLSRFLIVSVVSALFTAVAQLTIGLIEHRIAVLVCLSLAVITVILFAVNIGLIALNLREWFKFLESDAKRKSADRQKQRDSVGDGKR